MIEIHIPKKIWCGYKFNKWAKILILDAIKEEFKKPIHLRISQTELVKQVIKGEYK